MPTVSVTVSTDALARIHAAVASVYGYSDKLSDGTKNPQNIQQFTAEAIANFLKDVVRSFEANRAAEGVRHSAEIVIS